MTARGRVIALQMLTDRLTGLVADVSSSRVVVQSWFSSPRPKEVDPSDAGAMASWVEREIGSEFKGRVVLVVPRGEVVLKRINLPASAGRDRTLPSIVQLQMSRQLAASMSGMAVDYVTLPSLESPDEIGVVAAALPGDRLEALRGLVSRRGRRALAGIALRSAGVASLVRASEQLREGAVLAVAPGWDATELVIVEAGQLVFVRAADIGLPESPDRESMAAYAERIAVEAKRTWMSYRGGRDSSEVSSVAVLGPAEMVEPVGRACGEALALPWRAIGLPDCVEVPDSMPATALCASAPLLGVLAEAITGERSFDFANPRRAPDLSAARRQRVLLAVLLAIVVGGGLYVLGLMQLDDLRSRLGRVQSRAKELENDYVQLLCDEARLRHIEKWREPEADWLAHLAWLSEQTPAPPMALLDEVRGELAYGVQFDGGRDRDLSTGRWDVSQRVTISMSGSVSEWTVADGLRESLLASNVFLDVTTRTPDAGNRFDFEMVTSAARPHGKASGGVGSGGEGIAQ